MNQTRLTRAEWTGEVNFMLHTYKAFASEDDAAGIVSYFAARKVGLQRW